MTATTILRFAALLGAFSVALGAFGAHGLERLVTPERVETFTTGVRYQFYHTFAIALCGLVLASESGGGPWVGRAVWLFGLGILLFSGSLYLLSLRTVHGLPVGFLGPVTPVGGLLLIGGWVALFWGIGRG